MTQITIKYDQSFFMRLVMDKYAEEMERKKPKTTQIARYAFLQTMSDQELESFLQRYLDEHNLKEVTLKDWQKDCAVLFGYIDESIRFKELVMKIQQVK